MMYQVCGKFRLLNVINSNGKTCLPTNWCNHFPNTSIFPSSFLDTHFFPILQLVGFFPILYVVVFMESRKLDKHYRILKRWNYHSSEDDGHVLTGFFIPIKVAQLLIFSQ